MTVIGTNWESDILFNQIMRDDLFEWLQGRVYRLLKRVFMAHQRFRLSLVVTFMYDGVLV